MVVQERLQGGLMHTAHSEYGQQYASCAPRVKDWRAHPGGELRNQPWPATKVPADRSELRVFTPARRRQHSTTPAPSAARQT